MQYPRIKSINIKGYRTFKDFTATLSDLEIIVGANGAGKTCLLEFLKLLRNGMKKPIFPEILAGFLGKNVFYVGGEEKIQWQLEIELDETITLRYLGEILGPINSPQIAREKVEAIAIFNERQEPSILLDVKENSGQVREKLEEEITTLPNELALSKIDNQGMVNLYKLREYIGGWKFYSSFNIAREKISRSVAIAPQPH
ncbi:MAG: AAA family ATPase [Okeania sp. SIO2H7]|nr:AAA family ATPase [Okeania sp. SIO2H7]